MKLDVPLTRQDENSLDCGIACLSMLLKYYGIEKGISDIKKDVKIHDGIGTYGPQLGKYLIEQGFEIELVTMNPFLFTNKFKNYSQKDVLNHFKELLEKTTQEKFKIPLEFFIEFIEAGGKIKVKIPSIEDIKSEISEKRPLGALITSNFLLYDKPIFNFHFNLITGIDEEFVYVNDPLPDYRGGSHKYQINDFIYALYASAYGDSDNAMLMKIVKK